LIFLMSKFSFLCLIKKTYSHYFHFVLLWQWSLIGNFSMDIGFLDLLSQFSTEATWWRQLRLIFQKTVSNDPRHNDQAISVILQSCFD
jgi:hypothetical protein